MPSAESGKAPTLEGCEWVFNSLSGGICSGSSSCYHLSTCVYTGEKKWYKYIHIDSLEGTYFFCYISALAEPSLSKDPFFTLVLAVHKETVGGKSYFCYNNLIWTLLVDRNYCLTSCLSKIVNNHMNFAGDRASSYAWRRMVDTVKVYIVCLYYLKYFALCSFLIIIIFFSLFVERMSSLSYYSSNLPNKDMMVWDV